MPLTEEQINMLEILALALAGAGLVLGLYISWRKASTATTKLLARTAWQLAGG